MLNKNLQNFQIKKLERPDGLQFKPHDLLDIRYLSEIEELLSENSNLNIVMDFWAEWCGPCKAFSSIFERLHEIYDEYFIFAKINIEQDMKIKWKYKITSIPTCIIIKKGKLVYKCSEIIDYPKLEEVLDRYKDL